MISPHLISASSISYLAMGAFFGLTAGISPGPLLTLVISETLKHNKEEGIKIALAPLITDLPIILFTAFVFSELSHFDALLGLISVLGGIFFSFLGYETIKSKGFDVEVSKQNPGSLRKGIMANFLNPQPYMFWFTVGIPTAFKAYEKSIITAVIYFLLFYIMLVGSKILIALLAEKSKSFLKNNKSIIVLRILGAALFIFALLFFYDGIKTFKEIF
jgi:threonine/homoserine/homoserine lactone efflux protein